MVSKLHVFFHDEIMKIFLRWVMGGYNGGPSSIKKFRQNGREQHMKQQMIVKYESDEDKYFKFI